MTISVKQAVFIYNTLLNCEEGDAISVLCGAPTSVALVVDNKEEQARRTEAAIFLRRLAITLEGARE